MEKERPSHLWRSLPFNGKDRYILLFDERLQEIMLDKRGVVCYTIQALKVRNKISRSRAVGSSSGS